MRKLGQENPSMLLTWLQPTVDTEWHVALFARRSLFQQLVATCGYLIEKGGSSIMSAVGVNIVNRTFG